jgi:hypothetical protein
MRPTFVQPFAQFVVSCCGGGSPVADAVQLGVWHVFMSNGHQTIPQARTAIVFTVSLVVLGAG